MSSAGDNPEVAIDVFPWLQVLKDGTVNRIAGAEVAPAGLDPETDVLSKDVVIVSETGLSVRIYRPNSTKNERKLPLVVYFHGGAFIISSTADPKYHVSLNNSVAEANIILVSVNYRLAPEHPLPTSYEDSWAAIQWVAAHVKGDGDHEPWLKDYADFDQVFLAGDSCGANIVHHLALRGLQFNISGIAMILPYFWGKEPIGAEVNDPFRREMVNKWWSFVCQSDKGNDDPLINPFVEGSPSLKGLPCDRVFVAVAGSDILRDRGWLYYDQLVKSEWQGKAEIMEIEGEDHVFHIIKPDSEKAKSLIKRWSSFINKGKESSSCV